MEISKYPVCMATYSTDVDRQLSSSGGIFAEIAKYVLDKNGIVFGTTIDTDGRVYHKYISNRIDLYDLLGSKYVQSEIGSSYSEVRVFLREGKTVLFCGTPCQTKGLLSFLGYKPDNLILIDFICHGVPSFKVFHKYIAELSKGKEIDRIFFRDKEQGWLDYSFKILYKNGDIYRCIYRDSDYMHGFIYDLFLRPSCYKCSFKGINRDTDFTMGDFWGIEAEEPEFYDKNGVSALLLHNQKAENILQEIKEKLIIKQIEIEEIVKHNPSLVASSPKNIMQHLFYFDMRRGVSKAVRGVYNPNLVQKVRNKLYRGIYRRIEIRVVRKKEISSSFKKAKDNIVPTLYSKKEDCCGCNACTNICPKCAIKMKEDKNGFFYPFIDSKQCVGCKSCIKVCPIKNRRKAVISS